MKPTLDFYTLFQQIYDKFNEHLFNSELPYCMIVITRKKNVFGYYAKNRWINNENSKTDEIAINPLMFSKHPLLEILQTMAHEMCHLWQYRLGNPSRAGYHNKEWGDKMISIGLMPSDTGREGGKTTGQNMADYAIEGGNFLKVSKMMMEDQIFKSLWIDITRNTDISSLDRDGDMLNTVLSFDGDEPATPSKKTKIKYSCPDCGSNVWGKPDLNIICGDCKEQYINQSE